MELSQKTFTKMKHFLKHLSIENSILLKGLKRSNIKSSKIACPSRTFSANLDGRPYDFDKSLRIPNVFWSFGLKELSEFGYRFG